MRHVFSTATILLALSACAHHPGTPAQAQAASGAQVAQQVCTREKPVGSNIPVTHCTTPGEDRTVQQMRDDMPQTGGLSKGSLMGTGG